MLTSRGAFDYLPKPFDIDDANAGGPRPNITASSVCRYGRTPPIRCQALSVNPAAMQRYTGVIGRLSRSSISVLINGESGTGRERWWRTPYHHSPRADAPFIALNMAAGDPERFD